MGTEELRAQDNGRDTMDECAYMALEEYCRRLAGRLGLLLTTVRLRDNPPRTGYRIQDATTSRVVAGRGVAITLSQVVNLLEEKQKHSSEQRVASQRASTPDTDS